MSTASGTRMVWRASIPLIPFPEFPMPTLVLRKVPGTLLGPKP